MQHLDAETMSAWIDGELLPEEMVEVRAHLDDCAACSAEVAELTAVSRLVGELAVYRPRRSARIPAGAPRSSRRVVDLSRYLRPASLAAIVIILAISGLTLSGVLTDDEPEPQAPIAFQEQAQEQADDGALESDGTDSDDAASDTMMEQDAPELEQADSESEPPMAAMPAGQATEDLDLADEPIDLSRGAIDATETADAPMEETDDGFPWLRTILIGTAAVGIVAAAGWLLHRRYGRQRPM